MAPVCKRRRCVPLCTLVAVCALFSVYAYLSLPSYDRYTRQASNTKCVQRSNDRAKLLNLTYRAHMILDSLSLDHWLMYGSLFGVRRNHGPLPWDYDVDMAVKGEQFSKIKFDHFVAACKRKGIDVTDKRFRKGMVALWDPGLSLYLDVFIYYEYNFGMMWRSGLDGWLIFIHYRLHHSFPARLVRAPMPTTRFGFFNICVPREEEEVLKYLYRYNWWKEVRPVGC